MVQPQRYTLPLGSPRLHRSPCRAPRVANAVITRGGGQLTQRGNTGRRRPCKATHHAQKRCPIAAQVRCSHSNDVCRTRTKSCLIVAQASPILTTSKWVPPAGSTASSASLCLTVVYCITRLAVDCDCQIACESPKPLAQKILSRPLPDSVEFWSFLHDPILNPLVLPCYHKIPRAKLTGIFLSHLP